MKLLVIILCLLSERFLVHASSTQRFVWFRRYMTVVENKMRYQQFDNSWLYLAAIVLPATVIAWVIYLLVQPIFFGILGFIFSLFVFIIV